MPLWATSILSGRRARMSSYVLFLKKYFLRREGSSCSAASVPNNSTIRSGVKSQGILVSNHRALVSAELQLKPRDEPKKFHANRPDATVLGQMAKCKHTPGDPCGIAHYHFFSIAYYALARGQCSRANDRPRPKPSRESLQDRPASARSRLHQACRALSSRHRQGRQRGPWGAPSVIATEEPGRRRSRPSGERRGCRGG
jgi:hypothetical protein